MRLTLIVAASFAAFAAAPALADAPALTNVVVRNGDMVRDANKVRLGTVNAVNKDGSVGIILNSRYVVIPASSLRVVDGKLVTSQTKAEISAR